MLLVVGGIKGGSGKTTIATNLCQMRAANGYKVLLVDADEQKSAYDWALQRDSAGLSLNSFKNSTAFVSICLSGKAVYSNLVKMREDYDDIIVDTGGRDTTSQRAALCDADKFLLPFKPSSIDIWTMGGVKQMISECVNPKLTSYAIISQADHKGMDNSEALEILREFEEITCLPFFIGNRKAFRNAAAEGLGVHELVPRDDKACKEMKALYDEIYPVSKAYTSHI